MNIKEKSLNTKDTKLKVTIQRRNLTDRGEIQPSQYKMKHTKKRVLTIIKE